MEQRAWLIAYDISDPKRLRRVFRICRAYGDHLQYSVFRAELTAKARASLVADLDAVVHHSEDQVLLVDLGPSTGRSQNAIVAIGKPYTHPERHVLVI